MSNQGFVKALNIDGSEVTSSLQLWNNLYDDGSVAEDIQLFQPVQELFWNADTDQIVDNKFVFTNARSVYKNGDQVQVFGSWSTTQLIVGEFYTVENVGQDLEGRWQFGFQNVTLSDITIVQFTRQITQTQLLNLVEPENDNQELQANVYGEISNVRLSLDSLSEDLGRLTNDLEQKLFPDQSVNLDAQLFVEGTIIIQDSANYNTTVEKLTDGVGPGIFVSDPNSSVESIQTLRKDSVTDNPWTTTVDTPPILQTIAASANVGELHIDHTQLQVDQLIMTQLPPRTCLDTGSQFAAVIDRSGKLWTLGVNTYGQLGRTSTKSLDVVLTGQNPEPVWCQVSVGANHVLALTVTGQVWCWGRNHVGQLGIGNQIDQPLPVPISGLSGVTFIHAGVNSSVCLIGDQLRVWGGNSFGQLALGNLTNQLSPQSITGSYTQVRTGDHSLVINSSKQLLACGRNNVGQLGLGNTVNRTTFAQVGLDATWSQIAVGSTHSLALKEDGSMWAWGANNRGQLGLTGGNRNVPTATGTTQTWSQVSAGTEYSLVINKNYALYAAGLNAQGQLANNSLTNRSTWTQPGTVATSNGLGRKTWASVVAGDQFSMGINHKGELCVWGVTTPFTNLPDAQTQPVILTVSSVTLVQDVTNAATIQVNSVSEVFPGSLIKSAAVPVGTRVVSVNSLLNEITLSNSVTLNANTTLSLLYDRWDSDQAVLFDRKTPIVVNDQTYYLLLRD